MFLIIFIFPSLWFRNCIILQTFLHFQKMGFVVLPRVIYHLILGKIYLFLKSSNLHYYWTRRTNWWPETSSVQNKHYKNQSPKIWSSFHNELIKIKALIEPLKTKYMRIAITSIQHLTSIYWQTNLILTYAL